MKICILPARGGSKRIRRKNIKDFCGKPIIYYPITEAIKSNIFDKVVVSTDDNEIASISKGYGAMVPFIRPKNLSGDYIPIIDVVRHCIQFFEKKDPISYVCCLFPTASLIKSDDLLKGFDDLCQKDPDSVLLSVNKYSHPIQRSFTISDGKTNLLFKNQVDKRTQDILDSYHDAGQFYFAKKSTWMNVGNLIDNAIPFLLPSWRVIDIDSYDDWERAEITFKVLENYKN